jgi:uncharacterized protein (TIGR03435 family)
LIEEKPRRIDMRLFAGITFIALLSSLAFSQAPGTQSADTTPTFEIADVHVSPHVLTPNMTGGILRAGRYDIHQATMLDLIRTAYGVDADKVLSGPSWLESDRFDALAKAPPSTTPETAKLMLQALLAERFKLVVHKDSHPLPGFALTVGKGGPPKLKEADGSGDTGCKFTVSPTAAEANARQQAAIQSGGQPTPIVPTYLYDCHNMTMTAFAEGMHTMLAAQNYFDTGLVVDQTGLKGAWDFNFKYGPKVTGGIIALLTPGLESISIFDAMDKQLGLKLDATKVPTPVVIIDSVNRKPSDNPPGVTTALPVIPTEFEVADLRLSDPAAPPATNAGFQPSGRVDLRNYPLTGLISLALNVNGPDAIVGMPKSLASVRVDLIAKMPGNGPGGPNQGIDLDFFRPALKALLEERFKLKTHAEERPGDAYTLTTGKPKLQKTADPLMRTGCKEGPGPDGKDPRVANPLLSRLITCQNMTMAQLAEALPRLAGGYVHSEVIDATGLTDAYDFTLSFSANGLAQVVAQIQSGGAAAQAGGGAAPAASDPGGGLSLPDAVSKQLGLKLETQKRPLPVIVIDHIEEKPADN